MPNSTHMSGCTILFQFLICNKWVMDKYLGSLLAESEFKHRYPSHDDWYLLSEFEGTMNGIQKY